MLERSENDSQIEKIRETVLSIAPTDGAALDVFCQHWSENGLSDCRHCGSTNLQRNPGERVSVCDDCGKKNWVTSEKLLERASCIQAYLTAALIREAGLFISGSAFARLTGVQTSTAYNILRKFSIAVANQLPIDAQEVSGRLLRMIIAMRTRETPARMHPFTEQDLIDEELVLANSEHVMNGPNVVVEVPPAVDQDDFENSTQLVLAELSPDTGLTADAVSARTGIAVGIVTGSLFVLELNGKAHSILGGKYFLCVESAAEKFLHQDDSKLADSVKLMAKKYLSVIDEYLHRVGRKGLQHHLAAVWCALDRITWGSGSLMILSGIHPPVPYRQMRDYVSPPYLKIVIC